LFGLWKLHDVVGGAPQSNELTAFRHRNRIVKFARPISQDVTTKG
jgi:hypothetical protein